MACGTPIRIISTVRCLPTQFASSNRVVPQVRYIVVASCPNRIGDNMKVMEQVTSHTHSWHVCVICNTGVICVRVFVFVRIGLPLQTIL